MEEDFSLEDIQKLIFSDTPMIEPTFQEAQANSSLHLSVHPMFVYDLILNDDFVLQPDEFCIYWRKMHIQSNSGFIKNSAQKAVNWITKENEGSPIIDRVAINSRGKIEPSITFNNEDLAPFRREVENQFVKYLIGLPYNEIKTWLTFMEKRYKEENIDSKIQNTEVNIREFKEAIFKIICNKELVSGMSEHRLEQVKEYLDVPNKSFFERLPLREIWNNSDLNTLEEMYFWYRPVFDPNKKEKKKLADFAYKLKENKWIAIGSRRNGTIARFFIESFGFQANKGTDGELFNLGSDAFELSTDFLSLWHYIKPNPEPLEESDFKALTTIKKSF